MIKIAVVYFKLKKTMKNVPVKPLNLMVPLSMHEDLRELAFHQKRTMTEIVREILREGLDKQKKAKPKASP